ncbi:hypothetical protein [Bradyrhizobium sp. WYCCWR 12699]|uniref:hypothetical protein n=1 Tax=Bradyrhizobium sp. WYCCWR 12699 TaxID=3064203 RepID=UPI0028A41874|nr:hypothetical protein [Bradyrhizobium sp. WYCCWR 12699]MDT4737253.1 hypothetical protein [Bradyrhizobium sp. WYCCWR 12699]
MQREIDNTESPSKIGRVISELIDLFFCSGDGMFQYRVKVRGKVYLWGGEDIEQGFHEEAILVLRVDELGESVKLSSRKNIAGVETTTAIGTLKRGEALCIDLNALAGVWAEVANPALDTNIDCMILPNS